MEHETLAECEYMRRDVSVQLTCTFALHSAVMLEIFDPVTPGALRASMDWSIVSSSATQDDIFATQNLPPTYCKGVQKSCREMTSSQT